MSKNTSIALGEHYEHFVQNKISEGRFKNTSEIIRAGLRLLELEEEKFFALKKAIQEGIESGIDENFNPEKHLKSLQLARKKNV